MVKDHLVVLVTKGDLVVVFSELSVCLGARLVDDYVVDVGCLHHLGAAAALVSRRTNPSNHACRRRAAIIEEPR